MLQDGRVHLGQRRVQPQLRDAMAIRCGHKNQQSNATSFYPQMAVTGNAILPWQRPVLPPPLYGNVLLKNGVLGIWPICYK